MKKILTLSLVLGSALIFAPAAAQAKTAAVVEIETTFANAEQRRRYQRDRRWSNRRVRVVNRTRIVRRGWRTYREVWQYRYLPNGRVHTRLISRVRIR